MKASNVALLGAALSAGSSDAFVMVPWWGELIMAVVSAALAFFAGLREAR